MASRTRVWKEYRRRFDLAVDRVTHVVIVIKNDPETELPHSWRLRFNPPDRHIYLAACRAVPTPPGWKYFVADDFVLYSQQNENDSTPPLPDD